eukprot:530478_1
MALNKIKLNSIPQRNKDVVFGFTREQENVSNNNFIMPQMIKYLCLLYLNQNKDEFDVDNNDTYIKLNGNSIICMSNSYVTSCSLKNIVYERKHIWKFKINKNGNQHSAIGIFNTKCEFEKDVYFDCLAFQCEHSNFSGYGISFSGKVTNLDNASVGWGKSIGLTFKEGDIIEIILDFNEMKLYTKKDDKYVHLFDIEKGKYKAAVAMVGDSSVELLSYQEVY